MHAHEANAQQWMHEFQSHFPYIDFLEMRKRQPQALQKNSLFIDAFHCIRAHFFFLHIFNRISQLWHSNEKRRRNSLTFKLRQINYRFVYFSFQQKFLLHFKIAQSQDFQMNDCCELGSVITTMQRNQSTESRKQTQTQSNNYLKGPTKN